MESKNMAATSLKDKQSKLFDEWCTEDGFKNEEDENGVSIRRKELKKLPNGAVEYEYFRSDGVVNEEEWHKQKVKVVFILKETNGGKGCLTWGLDNICKRLDRKETSQLSVIRTWGNISRWLKGIQDVAGQDGNFLKFAEGLDWKNYDKQGKAEQIAKNVKKIVVINLKKTAGGSCSKNEKIEEYFEKENGRNACFFKRQYDLYEKDIVICCGDVVTNCIKKYVIDDYEKNKEEYRKHFETSIVKKETKVWYYAPPKEKGPIVIGFYHPQYPQYVKRPEDFFKALVQTVGQALDDRFRR